MPNALYDKGREGFLDGSIDWDSDDIKAVLVDTALYTVDLANDEFLSDIPAGAQVAISSNFTNKTKTAGVADADNITFSAVTGASIEAMAIFADTGVAATSRLIGWIDTITGLPLTPSGADIQIQWDNGGNRIFKL